jgi:hypothetical protein
MSAGLRSYGMRALCSEVVPDAQLGTAPVPPMHGTFVLIGCTTPSGVVKLNVPPSNAQIEELFVVLVRTAR